MKIAPHHLKRYKEIAQLFWKYGRSDWVKEMGISDALGATESELPKDGEPAPEQLASDLEAMGPSYVKLGQILSSRPDLLPEPYVKALARLQDQVKPFPFAEAREIISSELGVRISRAFSSFDPDPIAAASLGQVYSAALRDGRRVVVKVQRPGIAKTIADDFEVLMEIAEFCETHTEVGRRLRLLEVLEEFRLSIQQELDYEREAQNLLAVGNNLREFELIEVPQPVADYSTRRVLTMDYVQGRKITSLSPLARLDIQGAPLAEELFKAYLKQVLIDGLFHADPHPGNVFITDTGHIALLDLGMVGHITPRMQDHVLTVLSALSEGNSDQAAEAILLMSQGGYGLRPAEFRRRLGQLIALRQGQDLRALNVGRSLLEVTKCATDNGLYVPSELTLLGKTILQLDEIGKILDPTFDPNASIRRNLGELTTRRLSKEVTPGNALGAFLEMKDFVSRLPQRVNRILDLLASGEAEVKVQVRDVKVVMEGFQKIANRITTGIILAALIIGASTMTQTKASLSVSGYPGLAIFCFLAAAAGGVWLIISIFLQDRERRKGSSRS